MSLSLQLLCLPFKIRVIKTPLIPASWQQGNCTNSTWNLFPWAALGFRVFVLWMDKQLAEEEGVGERKKFFPQHNKIFSCETLFSSESYLYFRSLKEFSNFTPVTSFPKHLSKNIPCHIINYSFTDYFIISWVHYCMCMHTHSHSSRVCPIPALD